MVFSLGSNSLPNKLLARAGYEVHMCCTRAKVSTMCYIYVYLPTWYYICTYEYHVPRTRYEVPRTSYMYIGTYVQTSTQYYGVECRSFSSSTPYCDRSSGGKYIRGTRYSYIVPGYQRVFFLQKKTLWKRVLGTMYLVRGAYLTSCVLLVLWSNSDRVWCRPSLV